MYQSEQGLNETQRDANIAVLLTDRWLVRGIKKRRRASLAQTY